MNISSLTSGSDMHINMIAACVKNQADRLFPKRTDQSMFLKLYGEIAEMIDASPADQGAEVADVLIMVLDFAARKGIDIEAEIHYKMAINENRDWKLNDLGVFQHVPK